MVSIYRRTPSYGEHLKKDSFLAIGIDKTGCSLIPLGCKLLQVRSLISEHCRSIDFQTKLLLLVQLLR